MSAFSLQGRSLAARITTLLVIAGLLVMGGGSLLMDWRIDHEMETRFRQNLLTQARAIGTMAMLEEDFGARRALHPETALPGGSSRTWFALDCPGEMPQRSAPVPPWLPPAWPAVAPSETGYRVVHAGGIELGVALLRMPDTDGAERLCSLAFEQDRASLRQLLRALDWIMLLGPVLAAAVALLVVPLAVRRGLRPLRALRDRMRRIGPAAPGRRLDRTGVRELDPLVTHFNQVLERMDATLARERQFASGLAHETRTRLAELRTLTEVEARYPSGRPMADVLAELGRIGGELEATVGALLQLTRLQSGLDRPQPHRLALGAWLEQQVMRLGERHASRVRLEQAAAPCLDTDPALLELVVGNLLGNAVAYAPAQDTVRVRLEAAGLWIENACDLTAEDLAHLGQRFWRKRVPHEGHAGLGLALARAAADALGLSLTFELRGGCLRAGVGWSAGPAGGGTATAFPGS